MTYTTLTSVINRHQHPITVNFVVLDIGGTQISEGPPPTAYLVIKTFDVELELAFVGHPSGNPYPFLSARDATQTRPLNELQTFLLVPPRAQLGPYEQVDIGLVVRLERPPRLKGSYRDLWSLAGQIVLNYDDHRVKEHVVVFPKQKQYGEPAWAFLRKWKARLLRGRA